MKTLDGAFKKIYGEELAKYGFQKIKGRQPYFIRLIGDEILQVITYINEYSEKQGVKSFDIYCGVATVYRPYFNLEHRPSQNMNWFITNRDIYYKTNYDNYNLEYAKEIYSHEYENKKDESLIYALKQSFEIVKEYMLPQLNGIKDLKTCMEFYYMYNLDKYIYNIDDKSEINNPNNYYNEGLLHLKTHTLEEFIEKKIEYNEKRIDRIQKEIKTGKTRLSIEDFEKENKIAKKILQNEIEKYNEILTNLNLYKKTEQELERRKIENTKRLREYGI